MKWEIGRREIHLNEAKLHNCDTATWLQNHNFWGAEVGRAYLYYRVPSLSIPNRKKKKKNDKRTQQDVTRDGGRSGHQGKMLEISRE